MPVRGVGGAAFNSLKPGMVIIVKEMAPGSYALRSIPEISGGMVAEEVHTGRVLAMQGGFDVIGSAYNRATQALRQPGSAFKPIVYVTALQNGYTPATIELDAPFCVWQGAGLGNKCFVNFDRRSAGPHTLRWGLEQSRNLMTVRAASDIGMPKITDTARKLGVGDYENYLSIALGAGDTTVSRLVNAYAILANNGRGVKPTLIDYVQDRHGKVIYRTDNRCALMDNCNAPDWDGKAMPRPPNRISAPIFKQWAQTALKDEPKVPFVAPPGIRWVRIDRASGKRVFGIFPTKEEPNSPVIWEAFQPQTEPRRAYRGVTGDPYAEQPQAQQFAQRQVAKPKAVARPAGSPTTPSPQPAGLPTQNAL